MLHGKRALELSEDAISTRLLQSFPFGRGEQWMMTVKAWLFERNSISLGESVLDDKGPESDSMDQLQAEMLSIKTPADPRRRALRGSSLRVPNFRNNLWTKASGAIVVAGCVARAEVDDELEGLYLASGKRGFVERSQKDRIWGVGLDWKSEKILDEGNWRGANRLGKAHGEAARIVKESGKRIGSQIVQ
ncbi:hypothetical protein BDW62DRAFT_214369 [Aspergillus aurantiobrunneus]